MDKEDLAHLKQTLSHGLRYNQENATWKKAFTLYNGDVKNRNLPMGCGGCYVKVYQYHLKKANEQTN